MISWFKLNQTRSKELKKYPHVHLDRVDRSNQGLGCSFHIRWRKPLLGRLMMQVDAKTPSFSSACMPIIVEVAMSWKASQDRSRCGPAQKH
jgi:hypothetical protein